MLNPSKGKILYLKPGRMNDTLPIVIDGNDCNGPFGERIGRVYTLQMPEGSYRKVAIYGDDLPPEYAHVLFVKKGAEEEKNPLSHRDPNESTKGLPALLAAFDQETAYGAKPKGRTSSSVPRRDFLDPKAACGS